MGTMSLPGSRRPRGEARPRAAILMLAASAALAPGSASAQGMPPNRERLHQIVYCSGLYTGLADDAERRGLDGREQERAATALRGVWRQPVQRGLYDVETAQYAFSMGRNAVVELTGSGDTRKLDTLVDDCRKVATETASYREAAEPDTGAAGETRKPAGKPAKAEAPKRPVVEQEGDQVYLNLGGKIDIDQAAKELQEKIDTMPPKPAGP